MKRRIAVAATTAALAAGAGWAGAGAASAATPLASCTMTGSATFTPGLTSTPTDQTTALSGTLTGCTGRSGVKSGTFTGKTTAPQLRCLSVITANTVIGTGTMTVKWKGGTSSVVHITITIGNSDFGITGPVTRNRFVKHRFAAPNLKATSVTPADFNCSTVPASTINFSGASTVS